MGCEMIRFIDLTNQIEDDFKCFTFYDTVPDEFISVCGENYWKSKRDFIDCSKYNNTNHEFTERCVALIPDDF